jgi:hypothetical protein
MMGRDGREIVGIIKASGKTIHGIFADGFYFVRHNGVYTQYSWPSDAIRHFDRVTKNAKK